MDVKYLKHRQMIKQYRKSSKRDGGGGGTGRDKKMFTVNLLKLFKIELLLLFLLIA